MQPLISRIAGMRAGSLPAHPQTLGGLRSNPMPMPGQMPGPSNSGAPPAPMMPGVNPFAGNLNPGAFTTPAPFSPMMALLGQSGRLGIQRPGLQPRGPLGAFGLADESKRPRTGNPFVAGR